MANQVILFKKDIPRFNGSNYTVSKNRMDVHLKFLGEDEMSWRRLLRMSMLFLRMDHPLLMKLRKLNIISERRKHYLVP